MRSTDPIETRSRLHAALVALASADSPQRQAIIADLFDANARMSASHPINELVGPDAIALRLWTPLSASFRNLRRADDMFIGGRFQGADWVSAIGYLHGTFVEDYLGIPATGNWAYLRYGEFHQLVGGRIVRSLVIYDLPDLMRQAGVYPWQTGAGVQALMPGPASRDGLVLTQNDPAESKATLDLVESMIFEGLLEPAEGSRSTIDQMRPYWTEDMMWYGPSMIGATMGIEEFYKFHEHPWEKAFQLRGPKPVRETKHVTRFGDGPFCSFTGWPSIYAVHGGEFLGLAGTGQDVEIRVMDFYHRRGDKLDENWIFIDMPHLFLQLGVDLFARMAELRERRHRRS